MGSASSSEPEGSSDSKSSEGSSDSKSSSSEDSTDSPSKVPEKLYHYTTPEAKEKIEESGYIKKSESSRGDAVYGDGTYLTSLPPETPKEKLFENNYDGMTPTPDNIRKVDDHVEVPTKYLPKPPEKVGGNDGRDIYIVRDSDVPVTKPTEPERK